MLKTSDFDFELPQHLIAQEPNSDKEKTKMLVFKNENISDLQVINFLDFIEAGDVVVFNDAKVIKAKLTAQIQGKTAKVEINLDQKSDESGNVWSCLCKGSKKVKQGDVLIFSDDFKAEIFAKKDNGNLLLKFTEEDQSFFDKLEKYGSIPLPPYIKREEENSKDRENYQTVYAKNGVAVAAPTAGLHFTNHILEEIEKRGAKKVFVTLNVGAGTFLPVKSENILDHKMHSEFFSISAESCAIINAAKANKKRIIAVGTTSLRALESCADENGFLNSKNAKTDIFIYPSYRFKIVDVLMTNFHLPKSTLFMLISAFVGVDAAKKIYQHAIKNSYRFFSYGDASLLFRSK